MSMSTMSSSSGSRGAAGNQIPKGYSAGKIQQYTPEQMSLFQSLFPHLAPGSQLSELAQGSEKGFAPYEDYARRQFQELQGETASRFSGAGMGARGGSGFKNAANQQSTDFASQLAMQRQGLQRQALNDLMGLSGELLGQRPYEQFLEKEKPKSTFWDNLIGYGAPIAGGTIGAFAGGPAGALAGAEIGNEIGKGFRKTEW